MGQRANHSTRRPRAALALLALAGLLRPLPAAPAVIVVGGDCDLIEAIENANADDSVHPDCAAGSGADEIQLGADVLLDAFDNTTDGANGLPSITSEITLEGGGSTIARDAAAPDFRLFHVGAGGDLTLSNTTVSGGRVSGVDGAGGGVFGRGAVTLVGSTLSGNLVSTSNYAYGGAIYLYGGATLTLTASTVAGNAAAGDKAYGGGVFADLGTYVTVFGSAISSNTVDGGYVGGAGLETMGFASVTESTVAGNAATASGAPTPTVFGGGIDANDGLTLVRSTVSGNSGSAAGASGFNLGFGGGARVAGILSMSNSTLSGNSVAATGTFSAAYGGGLLQIGTGTATLSTFAGNSMSTGYLAGAGGVHVGFDAALSLVGSVVGFSVGANCVSNGTLADIGGNLDDDGSCGFAPPLLAGLDPLLADNGGPTPTHALEEGSSAVDHGGPCGIATDQRGAAREDGACDSGAYELTDCLAPDGAEETITGAVSVEESYEVCRTITLGPELTVTGPGGRLVLRAGRRVVFMDEVAIESGGELSIELDPDLDM